jgi:hypothetical protein
MSFPFSDKERTVGKIKNQSKIQPEIMTSMEIGMVFRMVHRGAFSNRSVGLRGGGAGKCCSYPDQSDQRRANYRFHHTRSPRRL